MPWPVQSNELVDILSLRKVEVGTRGRPERLKEALMLSDDENIVDIQFEVQFRIKDEGARDYLFNSKNPTVGRDPGGGIRDARSRGSQDDGLGAVRIEAADRGRGS